MRTKITLALLVALLSACDNGNEPFPSGGVLTSTSNPVFQAGQAAQQYNHTTGITFPTQPLFDLPALLKSIGK